MSRDAKSGGWRHRSQGRIKARGDKVQLYSHAQLLAQANALIGPWLVAQARARIVGHSLFQTVISSEQQGEVSQ